MGMFPDRWQLLLSRGICSLTRLRSFGCMMSICSTVQPGGGGGGDEKESNLYLYAYVYIKLQVGDFKNAEAFLRGPSICR